MFLKRQHSKKGNFVSSNAGKEEETLDIASIDFFQEILLINWLYIVASD